jgi:mRNA-degrading endonuclease HigB of HigAB toxin-antitoxin module
MIYLDSSVALAHLLAEDRFPPDALWEEQLVSSRLLEREVWNRINAHQLQNSHGDGSASILNDGRAVFNIAGNKYRIVVWINYPYRVVYVRFIGTHRQYDEIDAQTV